LIDYLSAQSPAMPVPTIIPTFSGARSVTSDQVADRPVHVRMTTFLPGMPARDGVLNAALLFDAGHLLARIDEALVRWEADLPERPSNWNIMDAVSVLDNPVSASTAAHDGDRRFWREVLEEFVNATLPNLREWPRQIIHNDVNGSNLLIDSSRQKITGLLDFGDVALAPRIVDLAVAAAYLVDGSSAEHLASSLMSIVDGYRSYAPLTSSELAVLPEIMRARYAFALTLNHARATEAEDATHIKYVLRNAGPSSRKLAVLSGHDTEDLVRRLIEAPSSDERSGRNSAE
jgi:Ser/Thr protein kinase RdoA (MazF antagonist)